MTTIYANWYSLFHAERNTNEEGSIGLHPSPKYFPRLPKTASGNDNDEVTLVWGPCLHQNRTKTQSAIIKNLFYPISLSFFL